MDLNELLYRHQIALMSVSQAERAGSSIPSFDLPLYYARRINDYRERRGLTGQAVVHLPGDLPAPPGAVAPSRYVGDMWPAHQPAIFV